MQHMGKHIEIVVEIEIGHEQSTHIIHSHHRFGTRRSHTLLCDTLGTARPTCIGTLAAAPAVRVVEAGHAWLLLSWLALMFYAQIRRKSDRIEIERLLVLSRPIG